VGEEEHRVDKGGESAFPLAIPGSMVLSIPSSNATVDVDDVACSLPEVRELLPSGACWAVGGGRKAGCDETNGGSCSTCHLGMSSCENAKLGVLPQFGPFPSIAVGASRGGKFPACSGGVGSKSSGDSSSMAGDGWRSLSCCEDVALWSPSFANLAGDGPDDEFPSISCWVHPRGGLVGSSSVMLSSNRGA
jgi:hypothetical protein